MRFTLDTNILVYALDKKAGARHDVASALVLQARRGDCVLTLQSLAELFKVLSHPRHGIDPAVAADIILDWRSCVPVVAADADAMADAMRAVIEHSLSFWDAMIWATARRAGCALLLSEDGQHGRELGGVTIVNPFIEPAHPLLPQALDATWKN